MAPYLSDVLNSFTNTGRFDTCGDCHAKWSGADSRGDFGLNYKIWDFDRTNKQSDPGYGISDMLKRIDTFNVGYSNMWKIANEASVTPHPFTGGADKDGDGYFTLILNHERPGTSLNHNAIQSVAGTGGAAGLPLPPLGWDLDDNDASINPVTGLPMGGVPWVWGPDGATYNVPAGNPLDPTVYIYPLPNPLAGGDDAIAIAGAHVLLSQKDLKKYFSTDETPPNPILDLVYDISFGPVPSDRIPLTWTAPHDDDPLSPTAGSGVGVPVHHYDVRFTTELLLNTYNATYASLFPGKPKRCNDTRILFDISGVPRACQIRNPFDWEMLFEIADCGINASTGEDHLVRDGGQLALDSNECSVGGIAAWNRGEATPLMRVLYESGFEDYDYLGLDPNPDNNNPDLTLQNPTTFEPICPPCGPAAPGTPEKMVIQEIDKRHPVVVAGGGVINDFVNYTDPHDNAPLTKPNYIAPDTVYWIIAASDDSTKQACIEAENLPYAPPDDVEYYATTIDPKIDWRLGFCIPQSQNDTALWNGPFNESTTGTGLGFESYYDPGFQRKGNIVAIKTGGGNLGGAAITSVSSIAGSNPAILDTEVPGLVTVTIEGIGFAANADQIRITSAQYDPAAPAVDTLLWTASLDGVGVDGTFTLDGATPDQILTFDLDPSTVYVDGANTLKPDGLYNIELWSSEGLLAAAWLRNVKFASTNPGEVDFTLGNFAAAENEVGGNVALRRQFGSFGTVSVTVSTVPGGTATPGVDYTPISQEVIWLADNKDTVSVQVPYLNDGEVEEDETIFLELSNPKINGVAAPELLPQTGGNLTTTLTITNDDWEFGTWDFGTPIPTIIEGAQPSYLIPVERKCVKRLNCSALLGSATVDYTTVNGTAIATSDYLTASGTLTSLDPTDRFFTIQVDIVNDTTPEVDKNFFLQLSNPGAGSLLEGGIDPLSLDLTIIDDDTPAVLGFAATAVSFTENAGAPVSVLVARSSNLLYEVSATYTISTSGSAATPADFNSSPTPDVMTGTLTWPALDDQPKAIDLSIIQDLIDEPNETFTITLSAPSALSGTAQLDPAADVATVTILDDDSTIEFSAPTYTVDEGGANAIIEVSRSDITGVYVGAVGVNYATADGTDPDPTLNAVSTGSILLGTLDYTPTSGTLPNWLDGEGGPVANKTFTVPINEDSILEQGESLTLSLNTPTGNALLGAPSTATLTIADNESPGTVQFSNATYSVVEDGSGGATTLATITVTRTDGSAGAIDIDYTTADNTAFAVDVVAGDGDYDGSSGTLSWATGNTDTKTFTVTINNDDINEQGNEIVNLSLSNPRLQGAADASVLGTQSTATLTIIDSHGYVEFSSPNYFVNEDGGVAATITATRIGGNNGVIKVDFTTADIVGQAQAGFDYTATTVAGINALTWNSYTDAGAAATKTISIPILNDAIDEQGDETVALELSNPTLDSVADATVLGTQNAATLTIIDSYGQLEFELDNYNVNEDGGVQAEITVTRVGGNNGNLAISWATGGTSATADTDYVAASGSLTWTDYDLAQTKSFFITVINDVADENPNETVDLTLSNPLREGVSDSARLGARSTATLTIIDSYGQVEFVLTGSSVSEDGTGFATITVNRIGGNNGTLVVNYATADGTNVDPTLNAVTTELDNTNGLRDYVPTTGSLTWLSYAGNPTTRTFEVPINNDSIDENDESLILSLSSPTINAADDPGLLVGGTQTHNLTITDSVGTIQFSQADYTVNEDAGVTSTTATITVTRTGGSNGAAFVDYSTADIVGQAEAGVDYTAALGTLTWIDNESGPQTFTVTVFNDAITESPDETIDLSLSNFIGATTGLPGSDAATLTIIDSYGKLSFSLADYVVDEDADLVSTTATITVTRVGGNNGDLVVNYAAVDPHALTTATAGADYDLIPDTLSWLNGDDTPKTIQVTIYNDAINEPGGETVLLGLSNPTVNAAADANLLGTQNTTLLTINDSLGDIQFSAATYSVNEDANLPTANTTEVTITVQRVGGSAGAASVNYSIPSGTAENGIDYTATISGGFSWNGGDSTDRTITITVQGDIAIEPSETVDLVLSGISGARTRAGTPQTAVLTIIDSVGRVEFVNDSYSKIEDEPGNVTITAVRVEGSGGQFDVPYATADGTATTANNDYLATSGTLSWPAGQVGNRTFIVTVNSDRNIELNETVGLTLSPPLQAVVNADLTILNDDFSGTLQFDVASVNVDENVVGGTVTLNVTRTGGDVGIVTVNYATADGLATNGGGAGLGDYDTESGILSWNDTEVTPKTITIPINDDSDPEALQDFSVTLSNSTLNTFAEPAVLGSPATSVVNIIDNDSNGTVQFNAPAYTVDEDGGVSAEVTVTRTGGSLGIITIDYATANGAVNPATDGLDYTGVSGTLTWPSGDSQPQVISIPVIFDTLNEVGNETVNLTLSNPTFNGGADPIPSVLGAQSSATLTIIDSYGKLQFSNTAYTVREDGGVDATITVTRVDGYNGALTIGYATADGVGAIAGVDYSSANGTLSWTSYDAADKTFTIPVVNDSIDENGDETVALALSNPTLNTVADASRLGGPSTATLTIIDSYGQVSFSSPTYDVNEDGGVDATVTVTRSGGNNGVIEIDFATADPLVANAATAGLDYTETLINTPGLIWNSYVDAGVTSKTISIPISNDAINEDPDETVNLTLSNPTFNGGADPTPSVLGAQSSATLTIIDSVGTIQFSQANYTVNEDGGIDATITVTREGGSNGIASVNYATANGDRAQASVDYTASEGTLTWANGQSGALTFTVPVINDAIIENPDETVILNLSDFVGATAGLPGSDTATLTIIDSFGQLRFNNTAYNVDEDGSGTVTITVSRVGGSNQTVSVDYATADNTAVSTALDNSGGLRDYESANGTLTWNDGDATAKTFSITINNDAIDELNEVLDLSLSNATYNEGGGPVFDPTRLGTPSTATLTIKDSIGSISFTAADFSVEEDAGIVSTTATVTVERVGGANGAASVSIAAADGINDPATLGLDYEDPGAGTLTWLDNESGVKTFTITIKNDAINENPDETIDLTLSNFSGARVGAYPTAVLSIIDSYGSLQFTTANVSVDENGTGSAIFSVTRVGGSNGPVSVNYATTDGTALAGLDYTATSGKLDWIDGDALPKSFSVPIIPDGERENDETVNLSLNTFVNARVGSPVAALLTIIDSVGQIQFGALPYVVSENGTSATITISRVNGSKGSASVDYATSNGTAIAGLDYGARTGTFNWVDGDANDQTFVIDITPDTQVEGDQTVNLTLTGISGAEPGTPTSTTLTITDAPGTLQFSNAQFSVDENGGGSATITVTRTGGSGGEATVDYATANGSAVAIDAVAGDGDYDGVTGTLIWANQDAAPKTFTIPINSDLLSEGDETLSLLLTNATGAALGTTPAATLKITDSPGRLQFSSASYSVNENGAGVATITVTRREGSGGAASVSYATADADPQTTAAAGTDYTSTSGVLNWVNGDAADKTFTVGIVADAVIEDPDEVIKLDLSGITGATIGSPISTFLTIIDSPGTLQFSSPTYSATENGVNAVISVTRCHPPRCGSNGAASVDYFTTDATASSLLNADYTATSGTLNWVDGDNDPKSFSVPLTNDSLVEGDQIFTVSLSNAVGAPLGTTQSADVTIVDDDIAGNLEFAQAQYQVDEDVIGGTVTINVRRSGLGFLGDVSVDYIVGDSTAKSTDVDNSNGLRDYEPVAGTLFWAAGDSTDKSFTITINPDTIIESGGELINLTLSNPTGGATLLQGATARQSANVKIFDSAGSLQFNATEIAVNELAGQATFTVERIGGSGGVVSVDYQTADVTAVDGLDYTGAGATTLTWAAGDTVPQSVTIPIIDDVDIEGVETFSVNLSAVFRASLVNNTATVTITSDDAHGAVKLSAGTYSAFEDSGLITFTVQRVGGSFGDISVGYQTFNDAGGANPATAGVDYTPANGTLNWLHGDVDEKTFTVALISDGNYESDETFSVGLVNPDTTTLNSPSTAVATITNDDVPEGAATSAPLQTGWSMISVPSDLAIADGPLEIFTDDLGIQGTYQWVVYDHLSSGFPNTFQGVNRIVDGSSISLQPGQGYWILNTHEFPLTLDDEKNNAQTLDPFEMTLQVGGGMFGNPYSAPIDLLTDVLVCNFTWSDTVDTPLTPGCTEAGDWVSWTTAATAIEVPFRPAWVTGTIYRYDTATGNYQMKNPVDGTMIMAPWEGYWYRTSTTDTLRIRFQAPPP